MLDFNAICRFWLHLARIELPSEIDFDCYLSWPEVLLEVIAFLRCLILMLFVVAGSTFRSHCFSSMLDLDAICRGRTSFGGHCLPSQVDFERYLWCFRALGHFTVCLRCLTLMLFVVFQRTWLFYCLPSMLDFDAICRGRTGFWRSLLFFDAWFWCYLSWPDTLLKLLGHFGGNQSCSNSVGGS